MEGNTGERPEEPGEGEGDDTRDTPKPKLYGEEIDPHNCEPEFIVTPPPKCEKAKIAVPAFRGEFCYFIFPGSPWETVSPVGKLIEAQIFFEKYCMYFNFVEKKLSPKKTGKYKKWYEKWKAAVRRKTVPKKDERGLRKKLAAANPGKTPQQIDNLVETKIVEILRNASIPKKLYKAFYAKMIELQRVVAGKGCRQTLIVFIEEYICKNPKPTRTSACQLFFNQVGIIAVDAASKNVLAHEMVHLLGKPATDRGGKITWEHEKCSNSVLHVTRSKWWEAYQFSDLLSSAAYQEIIRHQNKSKNRLIKKIR